MHAPVAEVWVRLRAPTTLEAVAHGLTEEVEISDELAALCEWIADRHDETTWAGNADDLRRAGAQLVEMVAPVLGDPEEARRRIKTWAEEWSLV